MRVPKSVLYCNVAALVVNAIVVWLTIVKTFPVVLGLMLFVGFLAGAVWFDCWVNGIVLVKKRPREPWYAAPTEKARRL